MSCNVVFFTNSQSEEDKQLQEDLLMMVERLAVSITLLCILCRGVKARTRQHKKQPCVLHTLTGEGRRAAPPGAGGAAPTDPLLDHLHDLGAQAPQISAPALRQAQRDL